MVGLRAAYRGLNPMERPRQPVEPSVRSRHLIGQSVGDGLFRREESTPVHVFAHLYQRLARQLGHPRAEQCPAVQMHRRQLFDLSGVTLHLHGRFDEPQTGVRRYGAVVADGQYPDRRTRHLADA